MSQWKARRSMVAAATGMLAISLLVSACSTGKTADSGGKSPSPGAGASASASASPKVPPKINMLISHTNQPYMMQIDAKNDPYIKELSRLSGYDLNIEVLGHADDYQKQLTVRFASGDLPDLIRTNSIDSPAHAGAVDKGVFLDLGPLIDKYGPNLKKNIPAEAWKSPKVTKNGKIYAIPALLDAPSSRVVYIRQDWLDKLKMPVPKTLDDYLAYFEEVKKQDMNGNGDPNDESGFLVRENLSYSELFFKSFGVYPADWSYVNGQLIPDMINPKMKDAIKFWKMLYDKGYINPNLFTNKGADWAKGIYAGQAGVYLADLNSYPKPGQFVNEPNAKVSMIEAPTGPNGDKGLISQTDGIYFTWVIPAKTKNPEEIIKFLDWAWSDEKADNFFAYGIEGQNYTVSGGKVSWDPNNVKNSDKSQFQAYRVALNPRGSSQFSDKVLAVMSDAERDIYKNGAATAAKNSYKPGNLNMPALQALSGSPELIPGTAAGSLFLDMFAKVITGKEQLDPAFDAFAADWKKRGGEAAIKEATDWYKSYNGVK
ncbi:type 2 periplasmic-binding domain-containing protein [Paenibacillus cymbidii]|uniref:extracellular solute-binding protein n=1 Tax=Paenibacillus cymbidii TaxID=1639034 RepID=UPI001436C710|nr:extracellular solute-binding protein [Paenibacillus cymbidii]